jgi:hypothetical protein
MQVVWQRTPSLVLPSEIRIFLLNYNERTKNLSEKYEKQFPFFKPHALKQTEYLENEVIYYLYDHPEEYKQFKYIGFLASTFESKIPFYQFDKTLSFLREPDLIYFRTPGGIVNVGISLFLEQNASANPHPALLPIFEKTLRFLNIPKSYLYKPIPLFFSNYFIMKRELFEEYLEMMVKLKHEWDYNPSFRVLLWKDARYAESKLTPEQIQKKFGVPYYSHHCFVLERLVAIWTAWKCDSSVNRKFVYGTPPKLSFHPLYFLK